jgi:hypothetical protein
LEKSENNNNTYNINNNNTYNINNNNNNKGVGKGGGALA